MSGALTAFLTRRLAEACRLPPGRVTAQTPLIELDLDSLTLVSVLTEIEAAYGFELPPAAVLAALESATPDELAVRLEASLPPGGRCMLDQKI